MTIEIINPIAEEIKACTLEPVVTRELITIINNAYWASTNGGNSTIDNTVVSMGHRVNTEVITLEYSEIIAYAVEVLDREAQVETFQKIDEVLNRVYKSRQSFNTPIDCVGVFESITINKGAPDMSDSDLYAEERRKYESRDFSWIKFNRRVLDLAADKNVPLLERLKYLAITASNMDEFMMVRMGGLIELINEVSFERNILGMLPSEEFKILNKDIEHLSTEQYKILIDINNEFSERGYKVIKNDNMLTSKSKKWLENYYDDKVGALITPIVFDNSRPFPLIQSKVINIGVLLEDPRYNYNMFGTIQLPNIERIIEIKAKDIPEGERHFIFVEDLIAMNLKKIFINKKILHHCFFRILRNFDDRVDTNRSNVFLADRMRESLKRRESGDVVRLEILNGKKEIIKILHKALKVDKDMIVKVDKQIDLSFATKMHVNLTEEEKETLTYPLFSPQIGKDLFGEYDIFEAIDRNDILLHHPYESFDSVVEFINQAAENPEIVSIKQTLYRLSDKSPIMESLIRAAEAGKQVTVLLEVKARFEELKNLAWATKLERAGGHVIYGIDNLKTHCKMTLVVRRGKKGNLKEYVHIGTGNYNDATAKVYTDLSLFTSHKAISEDVSKLFNMLTGFSEPKLKKIISAPYNLRTKMVELIDREIAHSKDNKESGIIMKINSLTDRGIIDKLYEASQAGVKIQLIVRGACSLVTGLEDYSKNITVISIVGRYLEHSRIFWFKNTGKDQMFIASSDMMERNLDKRFEIMVPVSSDHVKTRIKAMVTTFLNDSSAYELKGKDYIKRKDGARPAQVIFAEEANKFSKVQNVNKLFVRRK